MSDISTFLNSVPVKNITDDSRKVVPGSLFVAVSGINTDGHDYINKALELGAVAVVGEKQLNLTVPYLQVKNSREALSFLASEYYDNPSRKMKMIGITGTDGKTTTANMIYQIFKADGKSVGLISTVSAKIGDKEFDTGFHVTNPEPIELQKFLSIMVENGCEYCVLEVTSHGLDQGRVAGISFEVSVLTNVTNEHLDYHKTYENYLKTKSKLFLNSKVSILNKDDASFAKIEELILGKTKIKTYSRHALLGQIKTVVEDRFFETYNQENAAAAIAVSREFNTSDEAIIQSIKSFKGVKGRMEQIDNNKNLKIIVDFAHTPNSLEKILSTLKLQVPKENKLISVFGCAGERDSSKRQQMGEIATRLADVSIFTAEDPRDEKVEDIISQMEEGAKKNNSVIGKNYFKILERGEAINFAINNISQPGDTVVITGKGHEKSMAYDGIEYPWSDQEAVLEALDGKVKEILR